MDPNLHQIGQPRAKRDEVEHGQTNSAVRGDARKVERKRNQHNGNDGGTHAERQVQPALDAEQVVVRLLRVVEALDVLSAKGALPPKGADVLDAVAGFREECV